MLNQPMGENRENLYSRVNNIWGLFSFFPQLRVGLIGMETSIYLIQRSRGLWIFFVEKQEWRKTTTLQPIIFICLVHASFLRVAILKILYLPCHA